MDKIDKALLHSTYKRLDEIVGEEGMLKLFEEYRGQQINFPMRIYDRDKVANKVRSNYTGENLTELSKLYHYSDRWMKKIINNGKG